MSKAVFLEKYLQFVEFAQKVENVNIIVIIIEKVILVLIKTEPPTC